MTSKRGSGSSDPMVEGLFIAIWIAISTPLYYGPMTIWRLLWPAVEAHVPHPRLAIWGPTAFAGFIIGSSYLILGDRFAPISLWLLANAIAEIHLRFPENIQFYLASAAIVIVLTGFISTIFAAPLYVFIIQITQGQSIRSSHGTARWAKYGDIASAFPLLEEANYGGPVLGRMDGVPRKFNGYYHVRERHILTCAPTGSGKGIGCVIPNLLSFPGPCFVLDIKGENFAVTKRMRRENSHTVLAIDPFGITTDPSCTVDLFAAIKPTSEDCISEAASLVETLIVRSGTGESHWDDTAVNLLQGLVLYAATLDTSKRHLGSVREFITWPEPKLIELMQKLSNEPAAFGIIARAANAFLAKADRERSGVLSTAQRHTAFLDDPRIVRTLRGGKNAVDFVALKKGWMSIFLCIPPDKLEAYRGYTRAILGTALKAMVRESGSVAWPVLFLLDETAALGYFKPLEEGISKLRAYGVQLWLLVQDLSQLQAVYRLSSSFLSNTTMQFFGTQDIETARYISAMLGQGTIEIQSFSNSTSHSDYNNSSSSQSTTTSAMGRPLLTPDEIRRLDPETVIVLDQGRPPVKLHRMNYLVDSVFAGRFDDNPMHRKR